jgi:tetratricopeptide (TPR) repeat protein
MRIQLALASVGIAFLTSCAGHAPDPKASGPEPLASWNGGSIDQFQWENWKKSNNIASTNPTDLQKGFDEYLRNNLDARAALDAGAGKDSAKAKRWASITDRILTDLFRRDFITAQAGFPDTAIQRWASTQDSLTKRLPLDSLRTKGGEALLLKDVKLDSVYQANKSEYKKDSVTYLPYDSVKIRVRESAYHSKLDNLVRNYVQNLRTKYDVKIANIARPTVPDSVLKAYWKSNPDGWSSITTYRLSALGSKDSASLAKAVATVKTLDAFQKLSAKFKIGTPAAPNGELGRVKHQFSLPYGIGMSPAIFSRMDTAKVGHLLPAFRANDTLFVSVWLEGRDSAAIKPFESVRAEVLKAYDQTTPYSPPATAVMATWDKGTLFTKGDVDFISEEVPAQMKRQFPTDRVLDFMLNWAVSGRAAREVGLRDRPVVKATIDDNKTIFYAQEFRSSADAQAYFFPKTACDSALSLWTKSTKNWQPDSSKGIDRDGARFLLLKSGEIERSYDVGVDAYRTDSTFQPLDSVKAQIMLRLRPTLDERGLARTDSVLKARYQVRLSATAPHASPKLPAKVALDSARAKHDRRSLDEAETLYKQVEQDESAPDSIRAQALFQLGQLSGEQQNYPKSLESYRSVLLRFPKSSEAYKAQFMIAFTYSEYLKVDKIAVAEYRKVLANYPKCDLANDADWMIRNILSGGALMPKFDDSAFVADSVARADSLKKAGIKDTSKPKPAAKADAKTSSAAPTPVKALVPASKPTAAKAATTAATDTAKAVKPTPAASGAK